MGITIKQLSELSGYSTATISRVILNKPNVKEKTRREIEKLLLQYHYRTNVMELRENRKYIRTIMVIIGDLMNWYYIRILEILYQKTAEQGYGIMIGFTNNDVSKEKELAESAIAQGYAGLIFMNVMGKDELAQILKESAFPVVFLNRGIPHHYFNTVTNDNYQGGFQATECLIRMGHRKIGHLAGGFFSETALERCRGYEDAMKSNGIVITKNNIFQGNIDYESGYAFGERTLKKGLDFTALFISSYQMTMGVIDCFLSYGVRIPQDISIITFDETIGMKRHKISTICAEPEKMGQTAVDLLLRQISTSSIKAEKVQLEPVLNLRESIRNLSR